MDTLLVDATDKMIRVFIWTGQVAHLIDPRIMYPNQAREQQTAICGQRPFWPGRWFGIDDEYADKALALPLCGRCALTEASREVSGDAT